MSYENRIGVNNVLNRVSQIPDVVGAWFRVTGVLRAIRDADRDADRAAANGDPGLRLIARLATPRGYGQHVNWYELKLDPNNENQREELGEMLRILRKSLSWSNPARAIEGSRFIDIKVMEARNGKS